MIAIVLAKKFYAELAEPVNDGFDSLAVPPLNQFVIKQRDPAGWSRLCANGIPDKIRIRIGLFIEARCVKLFDRNLT